MQTQGFKNSGALQTGEIYLNPFGWGLNVNKHLYAKVPHWWFKVKLWSLQLCLHTRMRRHEAEQFSLPGAVEKTEMPHSSLMKMSQQREEHNNCFGARLFFFFPAGQSGVIKTCLKHYSICCSSNDLMWAAERLSRRLKCQEGVLRTIKTYMSSL